MEELITVQNRSGVLVVSSRSVADDFEKEHKNVIQSIEELMRGVAEKSAYLFIESEYQHEQNKQTYKEYLLTRDGFSLLVMGFTGQKSLQWKLKYIEAFNKMEKALQPKPMTQLEIMHQMTGALLEQDRQIKAISGTVDAIQTNMQDMREVIALDPTGWREDCARVVAKIAKKAGGVEHIKDVWSEVHRLVDKRMGAHLSIRITNIQKRLALEGASKTKIKSINALDAISENKRLIEGTCHIIKMLAVKNGVGVS